MKCKKGSLGCPFLTSLLCAKATPDCGSGITVDCVNMSLHRNLVLLKQDKIVTVYQFHFIHVSQDGFNLATGLTHDFSYFARCIIDQATGNFPTIQVYAGYRFTTIKITTQIAYSYGQQAFPFLTQRLWLRLRPV